jgi:hypothetical protein
VKGPCNEHVFMAIARGRKNQHHNVKFSATALALSVGSYIAKKPAPTIARIDQTQLAACPC